MSHGNRRKVRQTNRSRNIRCAIFGLLIVGAVFTGWTPQALAGPSTPGDTNGAGGDWQPAIGTLCPSGDCPPRASTFGYYRTQWRVWPGERRPDRFFPQSIGLEGLPTPGPEPIPQLPRQKVPTEKPSATPLPKLPTELPLMPPEEKPLPSPGASQSPLLPSDKPVRIQERSPLEGIQPSPLEPMGPGREKPGVQGPVPLQPTEKPGVQMPLPLEPMPSEKPSTPLPGPGLPGPSSSGPSAPPMSEQPSSRSTLPPLPAEPTEKPSPPPAEVPTPKSSSWQVPPADRAPEVRAPEVRSEPTPSRSAGLADPLEPWANPKPWRSPQESAGPSTSR
ncbi:MAG TPA: hypothetical protein PK777_17765, partial [Thermoguttaceae bacterium]|nr:hypothetical protein [Thermoguttaceae bacterium]